MGTAVGERAEIDLRQMHPFCRGTTDAEREMGRIFKSQRSPVVETERERKGELSWRG